MYIPEFPVFLRAWAPYISFLRFAFQALALNELEDNSKLPYGQQYIDTLGFDDFSKGQCIPIMLVSST